MFHTPNIGLTLMQAEAAGTPCITRVTAGKKEEELNDLYEAINQAVEKYRIQGVVTGAILSVYQATRIQQICFSCGLWCFNPLWHTDQKVYMHQLIDLGFEVYITGVFAYPFEEGWLGRRIDAALLSELMVFAQKHHITLTGEGGEYETFVADAPFFIKRIQIESTDTSYHNYHGIYHISRASLENKPE